MTISNAIPVQFWINGVETYNETTICGVEPVCFCQPFNCDDEIRIQFQDTTGNFYGLRVIDSDSNELSLLSIPEVSSGVYQVEFIPSNYGICDEKISLQISNSDALNAIPPPNEWNLQSPHFDSRTSTQFVATNIVPASGRSSFLDVNLLSGVTPNSFSVDYNINIVGGTVIVGFYFLSSALATVSQSEQTVNSTGTGTLTFNFTTLSGDAAYLYIVVDATVSSSNDATLTMPVGDFLGSTGEYSAQSDCLDIKTSHDCTELIEYLNTDDFSNIVYLTSPASEFKLRIPAQFWKEDNPMEQEDSELSNGVIKTRRQSIQEKRLLEVGFMPNYMHKKLQLVLMHDTITIDGDQWKRRDAYESEPIRRYPLKKANVWLTLYNSIEDNII